MGSQSSQFIGSIPEHYDSGLGPHIFVDYAANLTRRVTATSPARVLEIAAGTGIVTRMLRDALPATTNLIASDLNPPMLDVARKKFKTHENISFQPADATALPFADAAFDTVVCQFGVMFFPDKDKSFREVHRCLAPRGHYLFNVWDSFEYNPFARITHETIAGFFAKDAPGFYKVPFGYFQLDPIKASLIAAGFEDISAHVLKIEKEIPSARRFAEGLVLGNPVIDEIRSRGTAAADQVVDGLTAALQQAFGQDPGHMPLQAIVFCACKGR
jgi:ubiquinone/menaquinone biosynthesis C-methylase UbiE